MFKTRFLHILYNILFHIVLPFLVVIEIILLLKNKKKGWDILRDRLALYPKITEEPVIWYHAASLGEVLSIIPLMEELKKIYPHTQVLSVNTVRGERIAREKKSADYIIFFPLDVFYITRLALRKIHPQMIIIFETEIWPNFFWESSFQKIPILLVSGRISEKSFPRYQKLRFLFSSVLQQGNYLMKSDTDAERIINIGAPSENVKICGDIKYDGLKIELTKEKKELFLKEIFNDNSRWIIAGSTHRGEEKIICEIFANIQREFPDVRLLIAPRHLERISEVTKLLTDKNLPYELRTNVQKKNNSENKILVLNTYGELSQVYYFASIVFVGGSLVPIGGHNVMEAIAYGKPVICGNYYANFRRAIQSLKEHNAIKIVSSAQELEDSMHFFLANPGKAQEMGKQGQEIVLQNSGALAKCIHIIEQKIKEKVTQCKKIKQKK